MRVRGPDSAKSPVVLRCSDQADCGHKQTVIPSEHRESKNARRCRVRVVLLLGLLWGTTFSASWASCVDTSMAPGRTTATVSASSLIKQPYFYFPSSQSEYIIVADPTKLLDSLYKKAANDSRWYGGLRALVATDLPLNWNADLLKYVLEDRVQVSAIHSLLADLLESGDAAVFEAGTRSVLNEVVLQRENYELGRGRRFFAHDNLVLAITDCRRELLQPE